MIRRRVFFKFFSLLILVFLSFGIRWRAVQAATCTVSAATVINQAYVDSNSCTAIDIQGNVSTTWIGTVDLGGGIVTVKSGYTMTMGSSSQMTLGASDDLVVESTAVITHVIEDPYGIQISARNITVTGSVDATGKGCRGTSVEAGNGKGPDLVTGECGQGKTGYGTSYAGGSYGGFGTRTYGAAAVSIYGSSTNPTYLGSSGGSISSIGGGRVALTASNTLTISGSVKADGQVIGGDVTGGSGGSVLLRAGTLAGSGTISSNGGYSAGAARGGGGGGRVAIYYSSATFPLTTQGAVSAVRGSPGGGVITAYGTHGTVFILDRLTDDGVGTITFAGNSQLVNDVDYIRDGIVFAPYTTLQCEPGLTEATVSSTQELRLNYVAFDCATTGTSRILLGSSTGINMQSSSGTFSGNLGEFVFNAPAFSVSSSRLSFSSASTVQLTTASFANYTSSTFIVNKTGAQGIFDVSSDLTLNNFTYISGYMGTMSATGSHWFYTGGGALSLVSSRISANVSTTVTTLSVDSGSVIDATGKGCASFLSDGSTGYGPSLTTGICTQGAAGAPTSYGGGGYGGAGAASYASTAGATYGSATMPTHVGSSGGSTSAPSGGRVLIRATSSLTVNGPIRASGATSTSDVTAGSGGSILLWGSSLTITTQIAANGGNPGWSRGGGGGGRIAFLYSSSISFTGTSSTNPGSAYTVSRATTGTVMTVQMNQAPSVPSSLGPTALTNGATTGTANPIFSFSLSDPDVGDTVKFVIQIDDTSNFSSPVVDYTSALDAQGARVFQVGQEAGSGAYTTGSSGQSLVSGSYYWRVKAADASATESSYTTANGGSVGFIVDTTTRSVSFQFSTQSGSESVTATSVRIVLDTAHFETVTVDYSVSSTLTTAAGGGEDYTLASGTATIPAGETSTTVALAIADDSIDEPDEIIGIELSAPIYASLGATTSYLYTINDNDSAGISLSATTASVTEDGGTDSFTVQLTSQPTSTVQILFTTTTYGATFSTGTISFTSDTWNVPVSVTVSATNDSVDEPTMTDTVSGSLIIPSGSAYGYDGLSVSSVVVSITDNDTAGVTLSKITSSVTEGGATDSYTFVLTSQPTSTVRIAFTTSTYGVTLSASSVDFTSDTWSTPQSVTITATNDLVAEGAMATSVVHSLTVPTGYAYGYSSGVAISNMVATITDNDTAGITASTDAIAVTEGGSSQTLTYVLDTAPTSTVTLTFATSTSGIAIAPISLVFTSSNWSTPQAITITATDDDLYESSHATTVRMTVSGSVYGYPSVTPPTVTVTITDNESSDITLSASTLAITEGQMGSLTFVLGSQPTSTVSLVFTPSTEVTLSVSTLTFTDENWSTPQTLRVTIDDNRSYSGNRSRLIATTVSSDATFASVSVPDVVISVAEDDSPPSGGGVGAFAIPIPIAIPLPPLPEAPLSLPTSPDASTSLLVPEVLSPLIDEQLPNVEVRPVIEGKILDDLRVFGVRASEAQRDRLGFFVQEGASSVTRALGEGERRALLRDALETMRRADVPIEDLERMAQGQIPQMRNLAEERKQVQRALPTFRSIYGHAPNFSNPEENLAWNTLMYRIRFPRDLESERRGIGEFRAKYGRNPSDPFQWATVRVMGYVDR